jgi:hypothetical protein
MKKEDLLDDINKNTEDCFTIFSKGYLEHFDMDSDVFQNLLPKLLKESEDLLYINDTIVETPELVSDEVSRGFKQKSQDFYDVVQELCLDEVQRLPYVSSCIRILRDKASPEFLKKVNDKISQGYTFKESLIDGALQIAGPQGEILFSSSFVPMKDILQDLGINTKDSQFPLFYFGMFPKDEIYTYRLAYSFRTCFQF